MQLPAQLAAAIGRVVLVLQECGRREEADEFLAVVAECGQAPSEPPPPPPKRTRVRDDRQREQDAQRQRNRRNGSGVTPRHASVTSGVTSGVTSKGSPDLSKKEEKRKVSAFREVSAEFESSEKCESSHSRARSGVTDGVTSGVTSRDAARALRRLQDKLCAHWDLHSWLSELGRIAAKPEAEFAKVLEGLAGDDWVKQKPARANPGHVIKHWARYLTPEPPRQLHEPPDPDRARRAALAKQAAEMDAKREAERHMRFVPYGK